LLCVFKSTGNSRKAGIIPQEPLFDWELLGSDKELIIRIKILNEEIKIRSIYQKRIFYSSIIITKKKWIRIADT
jgi:hypothetical protein